MLSKSGVHLIHDPDGNFHLEFDDTPKGRAMKRHVAASGQKLRQTYVATYDEGHNRVFHKDKQIDQYARIQSYKDQCLIENIIKRCVGGDMSVLNQAQGMYGDITAMPTDPRSMHDLLLRAKEVYERVPKEVQVSDFGGSFENFLGTFGDSQKLDRFIRSRMNTKKEEVPADGTE